MADDFKESGKDASQELGKAADGAKKVASGAGKVAGKAASKTADFAKKTAKNAKKIGKKIANFAKKVGKVIAKAAKSIANVFKSIFKLFMALPTWLKVVIIVAFVIIILLVIIISILLLVLAFCYSYLSGGYDSENQTMSSSYGIKGDKFYGARMIYFDNEYTSENLKQVYLEFTENIIKDIKTQGIKLTLKSGYTEESATELITTTYAINLTQDDDTELLVATSNIDHYGFTNTESEQVIQDIANEMLNCYSTTSTASAIQTALQKSYEENFGYMKNVCAKIVIKDYLLPKEDSTLLSIPRKQFIASIYMPKQDVLVTNMDFIYAIVDDQNFNSELSYTNNKSKTILSSDNINQTWWVEGINIAQKHQIYDSNLNLNKFTAINEKDIYYLTAGKSLFDIIQDGKYKTYFSNTDGDYSKESLLSNVNSNSYLMLEFDSTESFNFIDTKVDYEK